MTINFSSFKILSILALCTLTTFAGADILRCEAGSGNVTYTNTDCGNDVKTIKLLVVEKTPATNVTYQQPSHTVQERSSSWANIYIVPRTGKVDAESVRAARLKMIAMDGSSPA